MARQRINPKAEQGFSILLIVLVALGIGYLIAKVTSNTTTYEYTPDHLEQQIKNTDKR